MATRCGTAAGQQLQSWSLQRPVAVDLFAGVGGFSLGFEQAGFDVIAALEYDPIHAAAHRFNFPRCEVLCVDASLATEDDVRRTAARGLAAHHRAPTGGFEIDVVFGGTPCQGFSAGGKRRPEDSRNQLVFEFQRLVVALRPRYFVMENVPAMRSVIDPTFQDQTLLDGLIERFRKSGYNVLAPFVLNAAQFGVPQDRRRLFLVGARADCLLPSVPVPTTSPSRAARARNGWPESPERATCLLTPTVRDALAGLPDVDLFEELAASDSVVLTTSEMSRLDRVRNDYVRRLRGVAHDPADLSYRREWSQDVLTASMRTFHGASARRRFARTRPGHRESISRFLRLAPYGLSPTLRAGTGYDRGSFMAPRPLHPTRDRVISVREAARLHSFPDWFRFHVTKWHGFRQIGNSLPPLLGRAVAEQIGEALGASCVRPKEVVVLGPEHLLEWTPREATAHLRADPERVPSHRLRTRKKPKPQPASADSML